MEYVLIVLRMAESSALSIQKGLGAFLDKLFENPLFLAIFAGAALLVGLWALKSSR
jgi:hypothetical protein